MERHHRGRTASYPTAPRTDPGVRNDRTGLFNVIRLRTLLHLKSLPV